MIRQFGLLLAVGIAAICLCSIILPARHPRHPRVQVADEGQGLPRRAARPLVVWLGSLPAASAIPLVIFSIGIFVVGITVEGKLTLQTDPIQWVNQKSQVIKDIDEVERQVHSSSEMGVYVTAPDVFTRRRHPSSSTPSPRTRWRSTSRPAASRRRRASRRRSATSSTCPGASDIAPTGADVEAAYDVAPADIKASTVSPDHRAMNIVFRTGPGSLEDRAPMVRAVRDDDPPAGGHPGHAVGAGRRRRRAARQPRGQPDPADLPRHPVRVPLPLGAVEVRRPSVAVAGAGADRGRRGVDRGVASSASSSAR